MTNHTALTLTIGILALAATTVSAQTTLSLDEAIALGLAKNRNIANASMQVEKADQDVELARTRLFPSFKIEGKGSQLLRPIDLTFSRGAFGDLPGIGPVPSQDATVRTPTGFNFVFDAQVQQPLTQLFKISLNVQLNRAARNYQREQLRDTELAVVDQIRHVYYAIVQTQSALDANRHTLALLTELERVVGRKVVQQVALKVDGLTV